MYLAVSTGVADLAGAVLLRATAQHRVEQPVYGMLLAPRALGDCLTYWLVTEHGSSPND